MKTYFEVPEEIPRLEFIRTCGQHVFQRKQLDDFEVETFCRVCRADSCRYFKATLNKIGLDNLVLPHHQAHADGKPDPDRPVKVGGDRFWGVVDAFKTHYIRASRFPECVEKINDQHSHFFNGSATLFRADFLFVSNSPEIAHEGHYDPSHGEGKIYMGNGFHRFVAYGLAISDSSFRPLEVYYLEAPIA